MKNLGGRKKRKGHWSRSKSGTGKRGKKKTERPERECFERLGDNISGGGPLEKKGKEKH